METTLGADALIDIATRFEARTPRNTRVESNSEIAADYGFFRGYVPRLALAGKKLLAQEKGAAQADT